MRGGVNHAVECKFNDRKEYYLEKVYELTVLFHPDLEIDLEKPLKKLEGIITENGGKIVKQENGASENSPTVLKSKILQYMY